jgi:hypothetical protein
MTDSTHDDTPFNMAMLHYMEIHDLRMKKSAAVIAGDLFQYYDCLEELRTAITFKINKKEEALLKTMFSEARSKMAFNGPQSLQRRILSITMPQAKEKLREIDRELMKLMNKYRMIFPKIETTSGLKGLQKRYGIDGNKGKH